MLIHTRCPIDDSDDSDVEVYPANFKVADLNARTFSARRNPDRVHYRMVRNTRSGCLRADPILDDDTLQVLYAESEVSDLDTWQRAADTYRCYFDRYALPHIPGKRGLLELGCGHGPFLMAVRELGFNHLAGIEPSLDAIRRAPDAVRPMIREGFLRCGLYPPDHFSVVCGFQVLDHIAKPNASLQLIRELLIPGGVVFVICHDVGSPLARLLGRHCPTIDIEHPILYDRTTIAHLFEKNGFSVLEQFGVGNRYPLDYWVRLAPIPSLLKAVISRLLSITGLGSLNIRVNAGNMGIVARKL